MPAKNKERRNSLGMGKPLHKIVKILMCTLCFLAAISLSTVEWFAVAERDELINKDEDEDNDWHNWTFAL